MSDLDSFFAKRDKKKVKKGKKFTTTEEITKRLETTEKKPEKSVSLTGSSTITAEQKLEDLNPAAVVADTPVNNIDDNPAVEEEEIVAEPEIIRENKQTEEEQWNDFKDDITVDVSSLKITQLKVEEEEEGRGGGGDGGEDGSNYAGDDKKDGVWKIEEQKSIHSTICEAVDSGLDSLEDVKATVAAMSANSWKREMQPSPLPKGSGGGGGARRKKIAPDITSTMAFPSLADAQAVGNKKKNQDERDMQESRGGGAVTGARSLLAAREQGSSQAYRPPMFRTHNKYGALTDQTSLTRHS